jgi:hypothetical protein
MITRQTSKTHVRGPQHLLGVGEHIDDMVQDHPTRWHRPEKLLTQGVNWCGCAEMTLFAYTCPVCSKQHYNCATHEDPAGLCGCCARKLTQHTNQINGGAHE